MSKQSRIEVLELDLFAKEQEILAKDKQIADLESEVALLKEQQGPLPPGVESVQRAQRAEIATLKSRVDDWMRKHTAEQGSRRYWERWAKQNGWTAEASS